MTYKHPFQDTLVEAIRNKQQLSVAYKHHPREICPHALGYKKGTLKLIGVQFGGSSESEGVITPDDPRWRCMFVDELLDIQVQDGEWHTIDQHSQPNTCIDDYIIEVEY